MSRRLARETALQVLFQIDMVKVDPVQAIQHVIEEFAVPEASRQFAQRLVLGTQDNLEQIDQTVQSVSPEWNIARMSNVDRSILRLAAYELLFCPDIPGNVTVNEAIELAKTYSGEEAGKFVNGILDALLDKSGKQGTGKHSTGTVTAGLDTQAGDIAPVVKSELE